MRRSRKRWTRSWQRSPGSMGRCNDSDGRRTPSGGFLMAKTVSRGVDLEPIDRLEEKIRMLVSTLERLKTEHTRVADENARLQRDIEAARTRPADAEAAPAEA